MFTESGSVSMRNRVEMNAREKMAINSVQVETMKNELAIRTSERKTQVESK
jgi:hypothetical protein